MGWFACLGLELGLDPPLLFGVLVAEPKSRPEHNVGESVAGRRVDVGPHRLRWIQAVGMGTVMVMPVLVMSTGFMLVLVLVAALGVAPTMALMLPVAVVGQGGSTAGTAVVVRVM